MNINDIFPSNPTQPAPGSSSGGSLWDRAKARADNPQTPGDQGIHDIINDPNVFFRGPMSTPMDPPQYAGFQWHPGPMPNVPFMPQPVMPDSINIPRFATQQQLAAWQQIPGYMPQNPLPPGPGWGGHDGGGVNPYPWQQPDNGGGSVGTFGQGNIIPPMPTIDPWAFAPWSGQPVAQQAGPAPWTNVSQLPTAPSQMGPLPGLTQGFGGVGGSQ